MVVFLIRDHMEKVYISLTKVIVMKGKSKKVLRMVMEDTTILMVILMKDFG